MNRRTWQLALAYWERAQNTDGSWGWGAGYAGTGSMTCAGIAAITIAAEQLGSKDATIDGEQVICCQKSADGPHIKQAWNWLGRYFSVRRNPGSPHWLTYYLYSLERVGRMTGQRYVGQHDWFREGVAALVDRQLVTGAWPPDVDEVQLGDQSIPTSFAVMFLAKARRPTLLANLDHEPRSDRNRHRHALIHLITFVERAWQRDLTYQTINLESATVEDLLEAPVLFLSGREPIQLSADEVQKLRAYLNRGGFLFAEQCCDGEASIEVFEI